MTDQEEPPKQPRKRKPRSASVETELVATPPPEQWPDAQSADFETFDEPWPEETRQQEWDVKAREHTQPVAEPIYESFPERPIVSETPAAEKPVEFPFVPISYQPETPEETVRQSGLAWSTGAVFFGSVAFMLFLGWGADLLFGSSPWGIVVGVVLGSVIGFIQFFRISSQIHAPKKEPRSFLTDDDNK